MWSRLASAFSLRDSLRALFHRPPGTFSSIDGLRALSILWVIAFHTVYDLGPGLRDVQDPVLLIMRRGFLGVDVFFVISGFLIANLLLREYDKKGTVAIGRFYYRRALRILPAYYVALFIFCSLIPRNCHMAWTNLLYINNFVPEAQQCMPWAWSLAVEEQFYLVFPLCLLLLQRRVRWRISALFLLLLLGLAIRAAILYRHDLYVPGPRFSPLRDLFYNKPYTRYGELLCGVIVAYLFRYHDVAAVLRRRRVLTHIGLFLAFFSLAWLCERKQPVFVYGWPPAANLAYLTVNGYLFSAAVAYIMMVCLAGVGAGRYVAAALSSRLLYPIGQLSYSGYLLHLILIGWGLDHQLFEAATTVTGLLSDFVMVTALSLLAAAVMYVTVEKPLMNLRH